MKLLVIFSLLLASVVHAGTPVWIDTDPSVAPGAHEVDDGFALIQAFRSPNLSIRGVSVVFGNAPLAQAFPIAQRLMKDFAPPNVPLYPGAASKQQLGSETAASRALAAALAKEQLVVIAIGPLTNVATVLRNHPELVSRIVKVIAVAGRRPNQKFVTQPGARPFRDFNFECDPVAFEVLLASRVPLVLAPWEISSKVWLREPQLQTLRAQDPTMSWVLDAAADWLKYWRQTLHASGFNPFDTLAVGYAIAPAGFQCENLPIALQQLPDDTVPPGGTKRPDKPYLIVDRKLPSKASALYCFTPPPDYVKTLMQQLARP